MKKNRIVRIVQIMWLFIAAVCVVEAGILFSGQEDERNTALLFSAVAVFAVFRYVMLRRQQLKDEQRM